MTMVLPGVSYDETLLTQASVDDPVTMPLFIGYTLADVTIQITAMQPVNVRSLTQAIDYFGPRGTLAYSLRHFFENGGWQCYVLSLGPWQGEPTARLQALIAALQAPQMLDTLLADDKTGLVLVPELSELNEIDRFGEAVTAEVDVDALWYQGWQALLTMCHQAPQRFALLELPDSPAHAVTLTGHSFSADLCQRGAAWWPRLETSYEDEALAPVVLSPLPAVAAAIQRSAHNNGVWKAPAKIPLAKTLRPTQSILTSQALLNNNGVSWNLIRSFVGKGVRLWGCRTLLNEENTGWSYIQTRLLVSSVENYLCKLARTYLFEPNTALTWMKLKGQVWTWLRQQWLAGALFGNVEDEAFSLRIGLDETMTEDDIRQGKMILQVGLALLAPAEFIAVSLTLELRDSTARSQIGG